MNANEISTKATPQMKRIHFMSTTIKALLFIYVFVDGLFAILIHFSAYSSSIKSIEIFDMSFVNFRVVPASLKILYAIAMGFYLWAVVCLYRLLKLYETGTIFSVANARLYKRLGFLAIGYGLMLACAPCFGSWDTQDLLICLARAMGGPWIFGGLFVVLVSSIMIEARKLQEEQELTV